MRVWVIVEHQQDMPEWEQRVAAAGFAPHAWYRQDSVPSRTDLCLVVLRFHPRFSQFWVGKLPMKLLVVSTYPCDVLRVCSALPQPLAATTPANARGSTWRTICCGSPRCMQAIWCWPRDGRRNQRSSGQTFERSNGVVNREYAMKPITALFICVLCLAGCGAAASERAGSTPVPAPPPRSWLVTTMGTAIPDGDAAGESVSLDSTLSRIASLRQSQPRVRGRRRCCSWR